MRWVGMSVRVAAVVALGAAAGAPAPAAAQGSPCAAVLPAELTGVLGASFGDGIAAGSTCTWETETTGGDRLLVILDLEADPLDQLASLDPAGEATTIGGVPAWRGASEEAGLPSGVAAADPDGHPIAAEVATTDAAVDAIGTASAIVELVLPRVADGDVIAPPVATPAADDFCGLFGDAEVDALMGIDLAAISSPGGCLWTNSEPGRSLVSLTIMLDPTSLAAVVRVFADAEPLTIAGLPALAYGFAAGDGRQAFVSVDIGGGELLTVIVGHDDPAVDADALAATIAAEAFARGVPGFAPAGSPAT